MPTVLASTLREQDSNLYRELWMDEVYEHLQTLFDLHIAKDGLGILRIMDNIHWVIGDSETAIEWWEETR
jgi:hypothetical protein